MSPEIRPAHEDDIPALIAADPFAQSHASRRAQIAQWVDAGQCFIAERGGAVVGYAVLTRDFFDCFFIKLLAVAAHERRTGIGTALVRAIFDLVPPGEKLWTSTNRSNAPMLRLLPRLGFIESGRIDNLDDDDPELIFLHAPSG